ncbi:YdhK family protein [Halobacillus sp. Cin3]|uniref:YdhK family protein n=1 Tax=Halobacillus sp. Cin3 TaxID=2928441 RepID=UPI00248DDBCA|nr:YdhK family protein [Halobacillus sp. Cin3]
MKKYNVSALLLLLLLTLAACSMGNEDSSNNESDQNENNNEEMSSEDHSGEKKETHDNMNHSGSSEIPEGLEEEENPMFKVGSQALIQADHMKGMDGAEATITGAFDTVAYIVSYDPTNGGERVENHKWVIHEEIAGATEEELPKGKEVTLEASHMEGMNGAEAVIESGEKTTVYMVDYTPTDGGEKVTNHKWLTESELKSK